MIKKLTMTLLGCLAISACSAGPSDKGVASAPVSVDGGSAVQSAEKGQLKSFHFNTNGMSMWHCSSFEVTRNDAGVPYLHAMYTNPKGRVDTILRADEDLMKGFQALVQKHHLTEWNGYTHSDRNVLDADGFGLSINYADGASISASGYAGAPNGFSAFRDEFFKFRDAMIEKYSKNVPAVIKSNEIRSFSFVDRSLVDHQSVFAFAYVLDSYRNTVRLTKWTGAGNNDERQTYEISTAARDQIINLIKQEKLKAKEKQYPAAEGNQERDISLQAEFEAAENDADVPRYWEGPREYLNMSFKPNNQEYLKLKKKIISILENAIKTGKKTK